MRSIENREDLLDQAIWYRLHMLITLLSCIIACNCKPDSFFVHKFCHCACQLPSSIQFCFSLPVVLSQILKTYLSSQDAPHIGGWFSLVDHVTWQQRSIQIVRGQLLNCRQYQRCVKDVSGLEESHLISDELILRVWYSILTLITHQSSPATARCKKTQCDAAAYESEFALTRCIDQEWHYMVPFMQCASFDTFGVR